MFSLHHFIAFAGIWALGNGILHDAFVLIRRKPYDKELIRLLIDGHILIFSGVLYLLCYAGIKAHLPLATNACLLNAVFLIGYCAFIYKILPSYLTILINLIALVWLIIDFQMR